MTAPPPRPAAGVVDALRAAGCVFAEDEAQLLLDSTDDPRELDARLARRVGGEPLEQILGWAEFFGLRVPVRPGVFVPRRRTEHLVRLAIARTRPGDIVLDLCCGSGALGAAVRHAVADIELYAADIDARAVESTRATLAAIMPDAGPAGRSGNGGGGGSGGPAPRVLQGDLFDALPSSLRGRIAVLLCNTPYVPTAAVATLPPEARLHEPLHTLDGGLDGLAIQRRVAGAAAQWLAPGGHLLVESSAEQSSAAARLMRAGGLAASIHRDDEIDATVIIGTLDLGASSA